jgi:hypothetical protein
MVYNTELLGFRTLSIARIVFNYKKKEKHDVSETGSVSVLRWGEDNYSVGSLRKS